MSAASTPAPRASAGPPRHTLFWPVFIFLIGAFCLAAYQVGVLEDQLDAVTRSVDQMDGKVKHAQYEKAKFFAIARDLVRVAAHDPVAEQIVNQAKLRRLQQSNPTLMSLESPFGFNATDPTAVTNAAPVEVISPPATNGPSAMPTR